MTDTQTAQAHDEAVEAGVAAAAKSGCTGGLCQVPSDCLCRTDATLAITAYITAMAKRGFTMQPMTAIGKWTTGLPPQERQQAITRFESYNRRMKDQIDKVAGARVSVPTTTTKGTGDE
jgi:hypothetical protein